MVSDGRRGASHPVLYSHPETGKRTMCFHLGMTEGFVIDKGKLISTSIPVSLNLHHIKFVGYVTLSVPSPSTVHVWLLSLHRTRVKMVRAHD